MATGTTGPAGATGTNAPGRARIEARHLRTDRWWLSPAVTVAILSAFIVYSTWRAFANDDYFAEPYVSPFYSPCLASKCDSMPMSANAPLFGDWWGLSPRC